MKMKLDEFLEQLRKIKGWKIDCIAMGIPVADSTEYRETWAWWIIKE
jgi:hypothetical protein